MHCILCVCLTVLINTNDYYTAADVSVVWRPINASPFFTIVQIILRFLWDKWAYSGIYENEVVLMYTLEGVSSVANFITAFEESKKTATPIV